MRVAFVVQRYGSDVVGGAETLARMVAEKLHQNKDWDIEVFTTRAKCYHSWKNWYKEGDEHINSILVHRFSAIFPRIPLLFKAYNKFFVSLFKIFRGSKYENCKFISFLELIWFLLQGPYCPLLIRTLKQKAHEFDKIFFFTYLYYPTVFALPQCKDKAILIPTAHNENPLYFPRIRNVLAQSPVLIANTSEEKDLLEQSLNLTCDKIMPGGFGIDEIELAATAQPTPCAKIPKEKRYLLYLGRISKGKGITQLLHDFAKIRNNYENSSVILVLAGSNDDDLDLTSFENVLYLGFLSDEEKLALIRNCLAIINPSPLESLSLILLEALACKKPALINGNNPVLMAYAKNTPSVFSYLDSTSLEKQLAYLCSTEWESRAPLALDQACNWARTQFNWARVLTIYQNAASA